MNERVPISTFDPFNSNGHTIAKLQANRPDLRSP